MNERTTTRTQNTKKMNKNQASKRVKENANCWQQQQQRHNRWRCCCLLNQSIGCGVAEVQAGDARTYLFSSLSCCLLAARGRHEGSWLHLALECNSSPACLSVRFVVVVVAINIQAVCAAFACNGQPMLAAVAGHFARALSMQPATGSTLFCLFLIEFEVVCLSASRRNYGMG